MNINDKNKRNVIENNVILSHLVYTSTNYCALRQGHSVDSLISQIFVNRVRSNVVSMQCINNLLVREHPRVRFFCGFNLPHQELTNPSLTEVLLDQ